MSGTWDFSICYLKAQMELLFRLQIRCDAVPVCDYVNREAGGVFECVKRIVNQTSGSDFLQGQSWAEIRLLNSAASRSGNIRKEEILPCNKMDAARQGPCPHKWCSSAISQLRSVLEKALSTAHAPPFTAGRQFGEEVRAGERRPSILRELASSLLRGHSWLGLSWNDGETQHAGGGRCA